MQLVKIAIAIVAVAFTPSEAAEVASSNSLAASIQDKARAMIGTRDAAKIRGRGLDLDTTRDDDGRDDDGRDDDGRDDDGRDDDGRDDDGRDDDGRDD
jgi:hypothetical protein